MKKLFVLDLDGTLAESKSKLSDEIAGLIYELLDVMKVAVISGGAWSQFEKQFLASFSSEERFENLTLLPTCGTQFYRYVGHWSLVYSEDLSDEERRTIIGSLEKVLEESGFKPTQVWGEIIEDRGSQITFSALGQEAPLSEKRNWDPDHAKRRRLMAILQPLLPSFAIHTGGTTSIDVTRVGIDKAHGIYRLRDRLGIPLTEMLFAGDALITGGNDYPVQAAGVDSILVRDPFETARVIQTVIACLGDGSTQMVAPSAIPSTPS